MAELASSGKFVKIKCKDCGGEQVIFIRASTQVNCIVCGSTVAKPTGGKAELKGEVVGVVG
jgi:small subunit ribosomal protein S27e